MQKLIQDDNQDFSYDPFDNPPSIQYAQRHRQANMIGVVQKHQKPQFCLCCDNIVNKQKLSVCFGEQKLLDIGVGYPLYFKIFRYIVSFLLCIFLITGGAILLFMNLSCEYQQVCLDVFGIPVLNVTIAEQSNINNTQNIHLIISLGIFFFVIYIKTLIRGDIKILFSKKICPSQYTIMIQNVRDISDQQLKAWIEQRLQQKAIKIIWAYQTEQLIKDYELKQELCIKLNKDKIKLSRIQKDKNYLIQDGEIEYIKKKIIQNQQKINRLGQQLINYSNLERPCRKLQAVFVSFQNAQSVERIINRFQSTMFGWMISTIMKKIRQNTLTLKDQVVIINRAPAPKQVIWQNLNFHYIQSLLWQSIFIFIMAIILSGSLQVVLKFMQYSVSFRRQGQISGHWIILAKGAVMSTIVLIINCLMRFIKLFTNAKRYHSYTKKQASFMLYYFIFYTINSCCLVYLAHAPTWNNLDIQQKQSTKLLLADIHLILIANAFSQPFSKIFDPELWWKKLRRYQVSKLSDSQNPYTQQWVNKLWQGQRLSNGDMYQYIARVLFVTTWFASVAPLGVFLSLFGLIFDYFVNKYMVARVYKIPQNVSQDIAKPLLLCLQLLPLVYVSGIMSFNYRVSTQPNLLSFLLSFLSYSITIILLLLTICSYFIFCGRAINRQCSRTYSSARLGFLFDYQSANPLTRLKGDLNYLSDLVKQKQESPQVERISNLLSLSRTTKLNGSARAQLNKLKLKLYQKLSEISDDVQLKQVK